MPSLPSSVFQKFIFKSEQDSTRLLPSYALVKLRPSAHAGTAATEASVTVKIQLKGRVYTSGLRSLQSAWGGRDTTPPSRYMLTWTGFAARGLGGFAIACAIPAAWRAGRQSRGSPR